MQTLSSHVTTTAIQILSKDADYKDLSDVCWSRGTLSFLNRQRRHENHKRLTLRLILINILFILLFQIVFS